MKLYCNGELLGSLADYGYETPWASARLEPLDPAKYARLCRASHFANVVLEEDWGELSREQEEQEYERRLAQHHLSEEDLHRFQAGLWEIREAAHPDRQGPISLYECEPDGWIRWRWL